AILLVPRGAVMGIEAVSASVSAGPLLDRFDPGTGGGGSLYLITAGDSLNLRNAPVDGDILSSMPDGAVVNVLTDPAQRDGWAVVSFDGHVGWAMVGGDAGFAREFAPHESAA